MKYLSFKVLMLCILLPPVAYILSVETAEYFLQRHYTKEIEACYLGDTRYLLDGSIRLKEAVNKNLNTFLREKSPPWGCRIDVVVKTKEGNLLYPSTYEDSASISFRQDQMKVAAKNYRLMNEGLIVHVKALIDQNSFLSYLLWSIYVGLSLMFLSFHYRRAVRKASLFEARQTEEIARLQAQEQKGRKALEALAQKRKSLQAEYEALKSETAEIKEKANVTEDEMIEEIVKLEAELNQNLELQLEQQTEIEALKEKLQSAERFQQKEDAQTAKGIEVLQKRFKTLYKGIVINKRAVKGFYDLSEEMRLKAEEIIHQLNENPSVVPIKRKVFTKKTRETVLEVLFSYKGRLYYRNTRENKIEVLTIGTKNTQAKDLDFIDTL